MVVCLHGKSRLKTKLPFRPHLKVTTSEDKMVWMDVTTSTKGQMKNTRISWFLN